MHAFYRIEGKDLVVHFNIHVDPMYITVSPEDLEQIILNEINLEESLYFRNITIDSKSLEIIPNDLITQPITTTLGTTSATRAVTQTPRPPRRCSRVNVSYCSKLSYNTTTYPNILGHENAKHVEDDVIAFRELVDAECYGHAYEFVCEILQPSCKKGEGEDVMVLPCRSFCRDFIAGCGSRLLPKYKDLLDCNLFPEFAGDGSCLTKPGKLL